MTPDRFIDYFRTRHGWRCREGSAIYKDLSSFAAEQSASPYGVEDLYLLFCVAHAIRPKDATSSPAGDRI